MTLKTFAAAGIAGILLVGLAQAGDVVPERTSPEAGYVMAGDTLLFPRGGSHKASPDALREAYGLIGPHDALKRTKFVDAQGNSYQVGFRLEGTTLHFPGGGQHALEDTAPEAAEALLRETYGLVGERDALVRTTW